MAPAFIMRKPEGNKMKEGRPAQDHAYFFLSRGLESGPVLFVGDVVWQSDGEKDVILGALARGQDPQLSTSAVIV